MGAHKFGSIQHGIVFVCVKSIWILPLLCFSKWNRKPDSLLLRTFKCEKNDQISRSRLFSWEILLRNWILCVSLFQNRNPPWNVDKKATLLSTCDPQYLPLCVQHPHLLFLIRSPFRVDCFYVDVKRKNLETGDNKFTLDGDFRFWGPVLLSSTVIQIISFLILWRKWVIGNNTMYQLNNSSCDAQDWAL